MRQAKRNQMGDPSLYLDISNPSETNQFQRRTNGKPCRSNGQCLKKLNPENIRILLIGGDPMQLEFYSGRFRSFVEEMVREELEPVDYEGDWIEDNFDLWTDCTSKIIAGVMDATKEEVAS